jgi:hypothetical protein
MGEGLELEKLIEIECLTTVWARIGVIYMGLFAGVEFCDTGDVGSVSQANDDKPMFLLPVFAW